jgi:hypothetical protein
MKQAVIPDDRLFYWIGHLGRSLSGQFTFRTSPKENMKTRTRRISGFIVHIGESRSAGFWAVIKARDTGQLHFGYGKSFLSPGVPRIGYEVEFTWLPPADRGALDRAIEIAVVRASRKGGQIEIEHGDGATRLILRSAGRERLIEELQI